MFSKILCPVDLSESSVKALQWTEYLAKKYNSKVVVLHVIESLQANPVIDLDYPTIQNTALTALREFLAPLNIQYESMLSSGEASHKIVSLAEAVDAGLIVMGTRGLHGVSHTFLGSTTERVVRTSNLPVLTVTPGCTTPNDTPEQNHVLVPIPFLQQVPRGYIKLRKIVKQLNARPTLVHVVRGSEISMGVGHPQQQQTAAASVEYADIKRNLIRIGARIINSSGDVDSVIRFGHVADEILKELNTSTYSYLLMAVRKKGILPSLIESMAYQILSRAPVPVITVKKGD